MLELHNTRTRKRESFVPMEPGKVKIYTCGPTIHDYAHIGNFRTFVFSDLLRRYLKYLGFQVYQVMNLTDVEDKIIAKSRAEGRDAREYTEEFERAFFKDLDTLNIERCEKHPRATDPEVMEKMAEMIGQLLESGHAYRTEDGSIYFSIASYPDYGKFARIQVEDLRSGERVSADEYEKASAADFALWKAWTPEDGNVYWDSFEKLGKGRPGWHLECSAMGILYLGEQFDLHLGGIDLLFPHHQNEIAQSECCTGKRFVNYWVHCEHLQVEGEKMSKSLGNFYTLRDLLDGERNSSGRAWDPMAIRLGLLKVPHGSRLNFTFDELHSSSANLDRMKAYLKRCMEYTGSEPASEPSQAEHPLVREARVGFEEAMNADLNTSLANAAVFGLVNEGHKLFDRSDENRELLAESSLRYFRRIDSVLGLRLLDDDRQESLTPEEEQWIEDRQAARAQRRWEEADRLRDLLLERGIVLEDTPQGARWTRKTRSSSGVIPS